MKMNLSTIKNKNVLLAAAAILLFFATGSAVYYALRMASPKDEPSKNTTEPATKEDMVKKAAESSSAGQAALSNGDFETAAKKLTEAKELYEKANETTLVEQINDQLSLVEHEAALNRNNPPAPTPTIGGR